MIVLWRIRIRIESAWIKLFRKIEDRRTPPPVWDRTEEKDQ